MHVFRFALVIAVAGLFAIRSQAQTWTLTTAPSNYWSCVACSASGKMIVAGVGSTGSGPIVISTNYGDSWTQTTAPFSSWSSVASSADGKVLIGAARGPVYVSTNSGTTWNVSAGAPAGVAGVATSANGQIVLAAVSFGGVYLSTNTGTSWHNLGVSNQNWFFAAMSADGTTLAVGVNPSTHPFIATSTNAGATWMSNSLAFYCQGVAASADGKKLATAMLGQGIVVSTNSGASWTTSSAPTESWRGVASSADGTKLAAVYNYGTAGKVYTSVDAGGTWITNDVPDQEWMGVAESADGNQVVAVSGYNNRGPIYISRTIPRPTLAVSAGAAGAKVSWLVPCTNLVLQGSSNLADWDVLTNAVGFDFTNLQQQVTAPFSADNRFFRLATP